MATAALRALERLKYEFGDEAAARRLQLLRQLDRARLRTAGQVLRLHELLCFARACPDDAAVLRQAAAMLDGFDRRADLRALRHELGDSGIAGTAITYPFFAATAARLAQRWPAQLRIVWDDDEHARLDRLLQTMSLWSETPGLDELPLGTREWVDAQRGDSTDAAYVVRRVQAAHPDPFAFERAYEDLQLWLELAPGADTPSRSRACAPVRAVQFQRAPLRAARPDLAQVLQERPRAVRMLSPKDGARYVELARDAMVTRSRDLDAFAYGSARDVRLIDWEDGLQFAAIGMVPERRLMLEAVYGFLTLRNGVPMGYVLNSALFGSAEIAYNVFDTFRGGEAGHVYGRVLATVRHLFGTDSFTIYPYQLGDDNDEALQSGAWWFYQKLGFRARDRAVLARMQKELAAMRRRSGHRSSIATLRALATENVYYHMGEPRDDVIGLLPLANVGMAVTRMLARRFGADRERAAAECTAAAAKLLGVARPAALPAGERLWFERWAPLVAVLPGVERWPAADREALGAVMRKKGARSESGFARAFDAHPRLRRAVAQLARSGGE
ncbi:MAG: hypothetical protein AB7O97_05750 [Planctomycetota bacterium]